MTGKAINPHGANANRLRARRLGVDTQFEAVVFMHKNCPVCRSEGFAAHNRIVLSAGSRQIIATLYQITTDLLGHDEAGLSESAWTRLGLRAQGRVLLRPTASRTRQTQSISGRRLRH